jgi:hypothetical protein
MGVVILVLGVVGLCVALAAVVEVTVDAGRKRQYLDIAIILAVAALTVWLLIAYGDVLMQ